jgi:hypothetical protein
MTHSQPGRTWLAGAATAALVVLASCAQQPATASRPEPAPPAATPGATPAGAAPAMPHATPRDPARDSARLRALDGVGIPAPGAHVACAVAGRVRLDADSVALRFTAAFLKAGILPIRLSLPSVDGVAAGPVEVDIPAPARISARASTGAHGDSTAYRVEIRVAPLQQRWAAGDSTIATAHAAELCARAVGLAFPAGG